MNSTAEKLPYCPFSAKSLGLHNDFLDKNQIDFIFQQLIAENHWNNGHYTVAGRQFTMPRSQTWYADPGIVYNFTYALHVHRPWTPLLAELKQQVEKLCNAQFNSVLINQYRNGDDWVDWHSDNELELGSKPLIASLSLGQSRKFCYRHKSLDITGSIELNSGSLLIMYPDFQRQWQHSIARDAQLTSPRINLTFRYVNMPIRTDNH